MTFIYKAGVLATGLLLLAARGAVELPSIQQMVVEGRFQEAEVALTGLIRERPLEPESRFLMGLVLLRLDRPKESLETYTRAAAFRTPNAGDLRHVAEDYVLLGDFDDADKWMLRSVEMDKGDSESWYGLGRIRFTEQRFAEALSCFEKSLSIVPQNVKAEDNLGLTYEALNRHAEALAAYRTAIDWQKDQAHPSEQPLLNLGTALVEDGRFTDALPVLTRASEIAPKNADIHEQLGHLYLDTERFSDAQGELELAVQLKPDSAAFHFLVGRVYKRMGMEMKAKSEFEKAAALNGTHATPESH